MLDVSTITLYHVFKATPPFTDTISKPLGLSFDAALSSWLLLFNIHQMAPLNKMNY